MIYTPTVWTDRVPSNPGQFTATGAVSGQVTLALNDSPSVTGTPISAANLNHIETGIATIEKTLDAITIMKALGCAI